MNEKKVDDMWKIVDADQDNSGLIESNDWDRGQGHNDIGCREFTIWNLVGHMKADDWVIVVYHRNVDGSDFTALIVTLEEARDMLNEFKRVLSTHLS